MTKGAKPDTWMPLFIGDYLKDTARLSTEQHGAYLLLIMDYWTNGAPADDDEELAAITRLDVKTWRRHRVKLERFFLIEGGVWRHKRVDEELSGAQDRSDRFAQRAAAAAEARWARQRDKQATKDAPSKPASNARADATSMLEECPSPSPSPEDKNSDPDGSALSASDDDLDPIADLRGLPVAKGCWRLAVKVLVEQGRLSDPKARAFIGKLKTQGLTDDELWQIAEAAFNEQTEDPQPYLVKAAEGVIARRSAASPWGPSIRDPSPERQRFWMQDWKQDPKGWRDHERGPPPGQPRCQVSPEIQREFGVEPAPPQPVRAANG